MKKYIHMPGQVVICAVLLLMVGSILTGCKTPAVDGEEPRRSMPDDRVTLMPGDLVDVKFFYISELNESQTIQPDGNISLQLVGDVMATGLTPAELRKDLEEKYTGLIEKPSVAVIVREWNHRNIYVAGAVRLPGMQLMPGHVTALGAIMQAGGFDMTEADTKNVIVIRNEADGRTACALDLSDAISGKTPNEPFYLHAQDIVYVQRTGAVEAAQWINQHVTQLIPQAGFTFFHTSGKNTVGLDTSAR